MSARYALLSATLLHGNGGLLCSREVALGRIFSGWEVTTMPVASRWNAATHSATPAAVCPLIERSTSDNRWLIPVYKDADISIDSLILLSGKKGRLPWFPHSKLCKYNCSRNSLNT